VVEDDEGHMMIRNVGCIVLALTLLFSVADVSQAQQSAPEMVVIAGFDGICHSDSWCPLRVTLSNQGTDIEGILRAVVTDNSGIVERAGIYSQHVSLPTHSHKATFLYLPPGMAGFGTQLEVQLVSDRQVLVSQVVSMHTAAETDRLCGIVSSTPSALAFLSAIATSGGRTFVAELTLDALPPNPLSWEGLDLLVLNDVNTAVLQTSQQQALQTWLEHGGHLIVGGGSGALQTVSGIDELLPLTVGAPRSIDSLASLGEWLGAGIAPGPYSVASTTAVVGEALVRQDQQVLVAARPVGAGLVHFLAFDAGLNPFTTRQEDQIRLWSLLIDEHTPGSQGLTISDRYAAQNAVSAIPGIEPPSILQIGGFLLLYTLLVGPVNYLILRRIDRRELAWATIPVVVVIFTLLAYFTGFQARGRTPTLHCLAAVYVPTDSDSGRANQLVAIFSPLRTRYDLALQDAAARPIPGESFYDQAHPPSLTVIQGATAWTVDDLRLDVGALESLLVEGYSAIPPVESGLEFSIDAAGRLRIEGQITNGPSPLADAVLITGQAVQQIGDLASGGTVTVNAYLDASPSSGEQLPERIMGTVSYWDDVELYRRYQLLQSLFPYRSELEKGVYLLGWRDTAPLAVDIANREARGVSSSLYIYQLPVTEAASSGARTIPESLFTARVEETGEAVLEGDPLTIPPGSPVVLRFSVWPEVMVEQVDRLTLRLQETTYYGLGGAGRPVPQTSFWNWDSQRWVAQPVDWGLNVIPSPASYVHSQGSIRVQIGTSHDYGIELDTIAISIRGTTNDDDH